MPGRDSSPLGIPKSPSFHSGLDLVASASVDSLKAAYDLQQNTGFPCKIAFYATGINGSGKGNDGSGLDAQSSGVSTTVRSMQVLARLAGLRG